MPIYAVIAPVINISNYIYKENSNQSINVHHDQLLLESKTRYRIFPNTILQSMLVASVCIHSKDYTIGFKCIVIHAAPSLKPHSPQVHRICFPSALHTA